MAEKKRTNLWRIVALGAVLLTGVGLGVGASRLTGRADRPVLDTATNGVTSAGDPDALAELPQLGAPILPEQATTPELAVSGFLTAEANGDFPGSYAFLATADHEAFPDPAFWVQSHGNFPVVTGFRVEEVASEGATAQVSTLTGYRPELNEILGLVTARARSTWSTVQENGAWRVVFSKSTDQRLYPGDAAAATVARQWAERRIACESSGELEASLKGSPFLARDLCQAGGELKLGGPAQLSPLDDTAPFISAYGPDVMRWARAVAIISPQPMQVVLAPVGADWKVMGVVRQLTKR